MTVQTTSTPRVALCVIRDEGLESVTVQKIAEAKDVDILEGESNDITISFV